MKRKPRRNCGATPRARRQRERNQVRKVLSHPRIKRNDDQHVTGK